MLEQSQGSRHDHPSRDPLIRSADPWSATLEPRE